MQTIYLDISNKGVMPTIYAKQGDVGRRFLVVLTDAGVPYSPPAGSAFSVWYDGVSGDGNYTDIGGASAFAVNANTVSVELITQMLEKDGEGVLCLVLSHADGKQIGSWNIPYICELVPGYESEEAKSYHTAFSEAVKNLPYPDASLSVLGKAADAAAVGAALTQRMYVVKGTILTSDGTARGSGTATVHITPDGIARIDYAVAITESGTVENSYSVGLDIALLRAANQNIPAITPINGGICVYYKADGILNVEKTQYGGFHASWINNGRWSLGRVYSADGQDGSWPDTGFVVGQTIVGTCYGQVAK